MGIVQLLRHVTVEGNGLLPGTDTHIQMKEYDWFLQRPEASWRSNLHWFSPAKGTAHEHYLQALSVAGFNEILKSIANETNPELDIQDLHPDLLADEQDFKVGRYKYEYDVAGMIGDSAICRTSAVDYRMNKEMRLAATIYIADVSDSNVDSISSQYTQAYPPDGRNLLLSWAGKHWTRGDPSKKLPKPDPGHILVRNTTRLATAKK